MAPSTTAPPVRYLATDLDRTLFPNGPQAADDSLPRLKEALRRAGIGVIYVTGRNREQIREGRETYDAPAPDYAVAEVGTRIHRFDPRLNDLTEIESYTAHLQALSPTWRRDPIEARLAGLPHLRLQAPHNQNPFKISFHCSPEDLDATGPAIAERLDGLTRDYQIIRSLDETTHRGLVDILPARADKYHGLEFLRRHLGLEQDQIIYAGDSGNDLEPLASSYRSILVANATAAVRAEVIKRARENGTTGSLYLARPAGTLNGFYHSGILLGLRHYGIID